MAKTNNSTKVTFLQAIGRFWKNGFNFTGVATRPEYWYAVLFNTIVVVVAAMLSWFVMAGLALVMLVPGIALICRRFHDAGFSAWWILAGWVCVQGVDVLQVFTGESGVVKALSLIPSILMFIICCLPSRKKN